MSKARDQSGSPSPLWLPELAGLIAGFGIATIDVGLQLTHGVETWVVTTSIFSVLFGTTILALVARAMAMVTAPLAQRRWLRSLVGVALGLPIIIAVSTMLFQGTAIRHTWYATYGPFLLAPLLFSVAWGVAWLFGRLARWLLRRPWRGLLWPVPIALAGLIALADHNLYPNQYDYLHWIMLLSTALSLMCTAWLLFAGQASRAIHWLAPLTLSLAVLGFALSAIWGIYGQLSQQELDARSYAAGRLVRFFRALSDFDGDGHSVIFGGGDCNNYDSTIHPLAIDEPNNGIDEDCDGEDAPAPLPPEQLPDTIDGARYQELLRRWRREPDFRRAAIRTLGANIVLIVVDALRADQLRQVDANTRNHPRLMRLAKKSRTFVHTYSSGAGTDIGMSTIFTGALDPFRVGHARLLRTFRRAGYHTHGIFQREVKRWLGRRIKIDGLTSHDLIINDPGKRDVSTKLSAPRVTDAAVAFLERIDRPFLLWVHYFDVHEHHQIRRSAHPSLRDVPRGMPFYRALLRLIDEQVDRLLTALDSRRASTIVVLLADHGEGLKQQPRLPNTHGDLLYEPLVRVPLCFRIPGVVGKRVALPASIADVYPTLLDLAGIEHKPTYGLSLTPFLHDLRQRELSRLKRPIFLYEAKQRGVVDWPWKLLLWRNQGLAELYNVERDPLEQQNLYDANPLRVRELSTRLNAQPLPTIDRLAQTRKRRATR